ncbi:hypothetical protein FQA47_007708, partial [Oryzias melastigma]
MEAAAARPGWPKILQSMAHSENLRRPLAWVKGAACACEGEEAAACEGRSNRQLSERQGRALSQRGICTHAALHTVVLTPDCLLQLFPVECKSAGRA